MFQRKVVKRPKRLEDVPEGEQWCDKHNAFVTVEESDETCHSITNKEQENNNLEYHDKTIYKDKKQYNQAGGYK